VKRHGAGVERQASPRSSWGDSPRGKLTSVCSSNRLLAGRTSARARKSQLWSVTCGATVTGAERPQDRIRKVTRGQFGWKRAPVPRHRRTLVQTAHLRTYRVVALPDHRIRVQTGPLVLADREDLDIGCEEISATEVFVMSRHRWNRSMSDFAWQIGACPAHSPNHGRSSPILRGAAPEPAAISCNRKSGLREV